jgi:two-component system, LytTR family, sensor kinase
LETLVPTLEKACVLVTLMFALGRTGFVARLAVRPAPQDPLLALAFFLLMALTEFWIAAQQPPLMNARFIATCSAGLLAGPWIGVVVGASAGMLAAALAGMSLVGYVLPLTAWGLVAGLVRRYWPERALQPRIGFALGAFFSILGYGWMQFVGGSTPLPLAVATLTAVVNGGGVALLLLVVDQMRAADIQARAASMAEVRALQARMNPHFLFNALNTLAALAATDPAAIPMATSQLARFMRAALEQHDRPLVPLQEELDTVSAYLQIEKLRFGERLYVEQAVDPSVLNAPVPPFLIQPLVENAVRHGVRGQEQQRDGRGLVRLEVRALGDALVVTVTDNGPGIPEDQRHAILSDPIDGAHALALLRRRLRGLYGAAFEMNIGDRVGGGALVTVRLPRQWEAPLS